jgi:3-hydroxyisobutyrate dehydrogenase
VTNRPTAVAVLGAGGIMGRAMATNLARSGFDVRAWNRTRSKAEPLAADDAVIADTPAEAADGADIVLTMLADLDAVASAMDGRQGAITVMDPGSIWLQMSTIGETGTTRCADLAAKHEIVFFDSPVLGSRQPAEQRKLVILAAGPDSPHLHDQVQPVFDALGHKTLWLGPAGAGSRLKLALNAWVLTVVEAGAEIIALTESFGLDPNLIFEALEGTSLDLPYLSLKGKAMTNRDFEPAFRLALAAKDAALADDLARQAGLRLPLLTLLNERLSEGAKHHGDKDMSATYLTSARDNH